MRFVCDRCHGTVRLDGLGESQPLSRQAAGGEGRISVCQKHGQVGQQVDCRHDPRVIATVGQHRYIIPGGRQRLHQPGQDGQGAAPEYGQVVEQRPGRLLHQLPFFLRVGHAAGGCGQTHGADPGVEQVRVQIGEPGAENAIDRLSKQLHEFIRHQAVPTQQMCQLLQPGMEVRAREAVVCIYRAYVFMQPVEDTLLQFTFSADCGHQLIQLSELQQGLAGIERSVQDPAVRGG
ncbi:hypothetical protein D3C79_715210 [compost metagenome]